MLLLWGGVMFNVTVVGLVALGDRAKSERSVVTLDDEGRGNAQV